MTRGTVRLVPTTGPTLLADTFPVVFDRTAALRDERIWKARVFASTAGVAERGAKIVATRLAVVNPRLAASLGESLDAARRTYEMGLDLLHDEQHSSFRMIGVMQNGAAVQ